MKIAIKNGRVIDPYNKVDSKTNVYIVDGKIENITRNDIQGDINIFADGLVISPGFIDIHMHEEPWDINQPVMNFDILRHMVRMGVTSCIGGNCGQGTKYPREYLDVLDTVGCPTNLGLMAPHGSIRYRVGCTNPYYNASAEQLNEMVKLTEESLQAGCFGVSFGIRRCPGSSAEEKIIMAGIAAKYHAFISAHLRNDCDKVLDSIQEMLEVSCAAGVHLQIAHLGSMAAYGMMDRVLSFIDEKNLKGYKLGIECYPYDNFCAEISSAVFDEGFLEKYKIDFSRVRFAENKYRGQIPTKQSFSEIRAAYPDTLVIANVMKQPEVDTCILHPSTMIASDGSLHAGQGHPRVSGTFPKFIKDYVVAGKRLSLNEAIAKITARPASLLGLKHKGNLSVGSDADIVVFSPELISDQTAPDETPHPPSGINYVIVNGQVAVKDGKIIQDNCGRAIRKNKC